MKAIYTEAAHSQLAVFQERQKALIEELVAERKAVLGDEVLEITASDVKDASQKIRLIRPEATRRFQSTELVTRLYMVIGIALMTGSFFYPQIQEILAERRPQALLFLMGAAMALAGWVFKYWVDARRKRFAEEEDKFFKVDMVRLQEHLSEYKRSDDEKV